MGNGEEGREAVEKRSGIVEKRQCLFSTRMPTHELSCVLNQIMEKKQEDKRVRNPSLKKPKRPKYDNLYFSFSVNENESQTMR